MKIFYISFALFALIATAACEQKGVKVGTLLKDCPTIAANQREDVAKEIKGMTRETAIQIIADKYKVTPAEAEACLK